MSVIKDRANVIDKQVAMSGGGWRVGHVSWARGKAWPLGVQDMPGSQIAAAYLECFKEQSTGIGLKVGPRLRESCLLAPYGRGGRVHAT